jgi:hypothetical protein
MLVHGYAISIRCGLAAWPTASALPGPAAGRDLDTMQGEPQSDPDETARRNPWQT